MKVVLSPNPYRDKGLKAAQAAEKILRAAGVETAVCLPFSVEGGGIELPRHIPFKDTAEELKSADILVCFGGDGTILHAAKDANQFHVPILGVNLGSVGFMAELELGELRPGRALDVACAAALALAFLLAAVWARRFRVAVRQGLVSVRPGLIGRPWSFTVGDITRVVRHINRNKAVGVMTKMTVRARGRRVSVETLMLGSEEFWAFIRDNVDPSRVVTKVSRRGGAHRGR